MLSDRELEQYSRQLMLPDFTLEYQELLRDAWVLVVGCGGLGSPLAIYLAAAGVGRLILADGDTVERTNLHRQILHGEGDIGRSKAASAAALISAHYPDCRVSQFTERLEDEALAQAVNSVQLVADGTDNYPTRFALNRACIRAGKPLVSAAAARSEGQLATFDVAGGGACYRCLYPREGAATALSCRDNGVLGPVVGVLGTLQALEVIKVLTGWGESLRSRVLMLDLKTYAQSIIQVERRADCPDCGEGLGSGFGF
ncbi:HesA/MoeB/ThiF family protein [Congregibacter litoralis]|uniref:Molybdopterin-synthase adenylyltransferase n=1 Tax=Congregibacter litoralis KT71 TaxID=314285 RepID=A4A5A3_9GAMM|nr:HesA/MoeB/ThiF family protein [Congregibacter litoralis]EAQ98974.1 Dinucleotide-utilizing enzyme involved in molybdopterin and thiamine biosynthesis family 2 [Congregibacter litoralis KT71]